MEKAEQTTPKLTFAALGGPPFLLMVFSYITQGMLFWGITLWIPLAVRSLGFSGWSQALASSLPYMAAVVLAIPMSAISDRTQKRVLIAALGMLIPGCLLLTLPLVDSGYVKLAIITVALGYYASSYTPNIWSILQSTVVPHAVGTASGIMNGLGAGGGGTIAGFLVAAMNSYTGLVHVRFHGAGRTGRHRRALASDIRVRREGATLAAGGCGGLIRSCTLNRRLPPCRSCAILGLDQLLGDKREALLAALRIGTGSGLVGRPDRAGAAQRRERATSTICASRPWPKRRSRPRRCASAATPTFPGYDTYLDDRMRAVLPGCLRRGTKIVTNQGWINPEGAARRIAEHCRELGARGVRIAAVSGSVDHRPGLGARRHACWRTARRSPAWPTA